MEPLKNIVDNVLPLAGIYPCRGRCRTILQRPGICAACMQREEREERALNVRSWVRSLPALYRDATWSELDRLRRHDGSPRVALREPVARLRAAVDGSPRVVLLGPAGSGKTTIAAAFLRGALERDPDLRVRFVPAEDLLREETPEGGATPLELALSADVLALDDAGAELEGAPIGSGLLAQRMGALTKLVSKRFDRGAPMLVTTGLEREAFATLYGDRIARRLFEGAKVIRIGGAQ